MQGIGDRLVDEIAETRAKAAKHTSAAGGALLPTYRPCRPQRVKIAPPKLAQRLGRIAS